jgi:hypothetical protein
MDLYVSATNKPTTTVYQCRSIASTNTELCTISAPTAGTYWVGLHAYTAFTGVTLTGTYTGGGGGGCSLGGTALTNGVGLSGQSGATSTNKFYCLPGVPAGKNLTIKIVGGTGDADLYTRFNALPTTSTYACRPYLNGNTETCTHNNTASAGTWYAMLRGFTAYSGVTITGSYAP